ncbi:MAG TPA: glycine oxidase ThiO [Gemmatimonadales bacterium]|jgi:glycine oxidase|nr:glycine oxidase ThiO [Gemmatimonadales bacterium]
MAPQSDTIVVGGGAIGAACARELALSGRKVLVIEAGTDMGQAWRAAGGMLAPQIEADGSDPVLTLGLAALDHYDELAAALRESTGVDLGLWRDGIGRVATDPADAAALQAKVSWQQEQGYGSTWLGPEELRRRWPWLGPAIGALWAPRDGALDPARLVEALLADARRLGASIVRDRVTGVVAQHNRIEGVRSEAGHYSGPNVIIAAGAWSGLIEGLPRSLPVQPVRGQMAAVPWPEGVDRAILYHRDAYILARGKEAILGSTMEYVGFDPEVTPDGLAHIFSATMALCPGLIRTKLRRSWAGLRPMTPDGLPVIGPDPDVPGLWYATGHGRNGILLAGLTGRIMAQLINGTRPSQDLRPFAPGRFRKNGSRQPGTGQAED